MLNQNKVVKYIKDNLAFPFMTIEIDDDKIIEYFTEYTLNEFSRYVPYEKKLNIDTTIDNNKVPGRANEFYIYDDEGLEILNVKDLVFDASDHYFFNHPIMGPMSHGELNEWALQTELANRARTFSDWNRTWEFRHPNVIRISPVMTLPERVLVEYETVQPKDLRGIPNEFQTLFCRFALADIKLILGRIRKRYGEGTLNTPFGEIPLSAEIYDEAREERDKILEKLEDKLVPNVIMDSG